MQICLFVTMPRLFSQERMNFVNPEPPLNWFVDLALYRPLKRGDQYYVTDMALIGNPIQGSISGQGVGHIWMDGWLICACFGGGGCL